MTNVYGQPSNSQPTQHITRRAHPDILRGLPYRLINTQAVGVFYFMEIISDKICPYLKGECIGEDCHAFNEKTEVSTNDVSSVTWYTYMCNALGTRLGGYMEKYDV
jgi:hypothetical protein